MMLLIDTKPENNNECMYSNASAQRHWLVKQQIVVVGGGLSSSRSKSNIIAAGEQWRTKWKNLKKKYLEEKLMASKSGKGI